MWRFESVHGFASVGNLYQKMHFAGSNLSTDPKCPKCIYKISKNFRVEKSGEISRNLRFSRFFVPASKSDTHHGWGGRIRTDECGSQSPVPYRLATPQYFICHLSAICFRKLPKYIIPYKIFYVNLFLFLYTQIFRYCKSLKFPIFLSILTIFVLNKNFIVFFVIM